jgi:hypothetical protein
MAPYYVTLGVQWCVIWCASAILLGDLPDDLRQSHFRRASRFSVAGVVVGIFPYRRLVLSLAILAYLGMYLLSYAPMIDAVRSGRLSPPRGMLDYYVPVQWLIDATPARAPLLRWADLSHVREILISDSDARMRMSFWGTTPAWLYAAAWLILGIVCVLGPAWIIRIAALRVLRLAWRRPARTVP